MAKTTKPAKQDPMKAADKAFNTAKGDPMKAAHDAFKKASDSNKGAGGEK